ncbi:hypothetical protein [Blastococcus sp. SYSU DS0617]
MTRPGARPVAMGLWAGCVAGAALLAARPGDPGSVPGAWLLVLALAALLAARGSRAAYGLLIVLNTGLLLTVFLLATPIAASLWLFYGLVAAGLVALVGVPLLARDRSPASPLP